MFRTHNARLIFLILLPVLAGLALFPLAYLYPFSWQPDVNPTWGWIICALGALVILIPVTGLALLCGGLQSSTTNPVSEIFIGIWVDGFVRAIFFLSGALLFVMGWALGVVLALLSHLVGVMLYAISFSLVAYGAWQAVTTPHDEPEEPASHKREEREQERADGYARGRSDGYAEGRSKGFAEGREEGYTRGRAEGYASSQADDSGNLPFDPWRVLELSPGSSQTDIRKAFLAQIKLYHPDRVSALGEDLRQVAERRTKELNRAYQMLYKR